MKPDQDIAELFNAVIYSPYHKASSLIYQRDNLAVKDSDGSTLLHHLYRFPEKNQLEMAQYLVTHHVPVNECTQEGNSPLHHLVFARAALPLLKYLVSVGADVNIVNNKHQNMLHFAVYLNQLDLVKELIQNHHFSITDKDKNGNTLLHHAMEGEAMDVIHYLVEQGLSLEMTNNRGQTPFNYAISRGRIPIYTPKKTSTQLNAYNQNGFFSAQSADNDSKQDGVSLLELQLI